MRALVFLVFCAMAFASHPAQAQDAACTPTPGGQPCISQSCATLGETKMDSDQKNIVVCLCPTANCTSGFIWK
jgi:hypothetical protein